MPFSGRAPVPSQGYLERFDYVPELDEHDVRHWLLPIDDVVYSYVVVRLRLRVHLISSATGLPLLKPETDIITAIACRNLPPGSSRTSSASTRCRRPSSTTRCTRRSGWVDRPPVSLLASP